MTIDSFDEVVIMVPGPPIPKARARTVPIADADAKPAKKGGRSKRWSAIPNASRGGEMHVDDFRRLMAVKDSPDTHMRSYTPKKTEQYENYIGLVARGCMVGREIVTGPVHVRITAGLPIPKSWPAGKREAARTNRIAPVFKPDGDNVAKVACDALSGIVYRDDAQAVIKEVIKRYADDPYLEICIKPVVQLHPDRWKQVNAEERA